MFASNYANGEYRVNPRMFNSGSEFGHYMESVAGFLLMKQGVYPQHLPVGNGHDINAFSFNRLRKFKVEVKAARRGKDNRFVFNLWKKGHTDHRDADVILLLAVNDDGEVTPFVIPVYVLSDVRQVKISGNPRTYEGKVSAYRNAWWVLQ